MTQQAWSQQKKAKTTHTAYGAIGVAPQYFVCPLLYDQTEG